MSNPIPVKFAFVPFGVLDPVEEGPKLGKVRGSPLTGATCVRACVSVVTHKPPAGIGTAPNILTEESPHRMSP